MVKKIGWKVLFLVYAAVMLWLLFDREAGVYGPDYWQQVQQNMNLEPFHTIKLFWNVLDWEEYRSLAVINLGGNIIMLIPLGFFLPVLWKSLQKWWKTWMTTLGIMLAVEVAQLFTLRGSFDVDDLILNLLGAAIGYLIYRWTEPAKKKK
jgi:glycopeptide antibiotics resistance protein